MAVQTVREAIEVLEGRLAVLAQEIEEGQDFWLDDSGAYKDWESEAAEREIQGVYDGIQQALAVLYELQAA